MGECPRQDGLWSSPENLRSCNRIAKDRVDEHPPPVVRKEDQDLLLHLAHFDDVFPPHPLPALAEKLEQAVLVLHAEVGKVDVIAVLQDRGDDGAEEEKDEADHRQRLVVLRVRGQIHEENRSGREGGCAGNDARDGGAIKNEELVFVHRVSTENAERRTKNSE